VSFLVATVTWVESAWVRLITAAMPPELRDRHRAERGAHVLDYVADDAASRRSPFRTASCLFFGLVVGMPSDIAFAIQHSRAFSFTSTRSRRELNVNWKLLFGVLATATVVAIVVAMIQGPEHLRQSSHIPAIRWLRGLGGVVLLAGACRLLIAAPSTRRKPGVALSAIVLLLIGVYMVRLGISPG
jgi:hypothetical protein